MEHSLNHWACREMVTGNLEAARAELSPPSTGARQYLSISHNWSLSFSSLSISSSSSLTSQGKRDTRTGKTSVWIGLLTPQGGCPSVCSSFSSEFPPRDTDSYLVVFILILPNYEYIFLTDLIVQESFCQFPASFY